MSGADQPSNGELEEQFTLDRRVVARMLRSLWVLFGSSVVASAAMFYWVALLIAAGRVRLTQPDGYVLYSLVLLAFTCFVFRAAVYTRRLYRNPSSSNLAKAMRMQSNVLRLLALVIFAYVVVYGGLMIWYMWAMGAFGP